LFCFGINNLASNIAEKSTILPAILLDNQQYCQQYCWIIKNIASIIASNIVSNIAETAILLTILPAYW